MVGSRSGYYNQKGSYKIANNNMTLDCLVNKIIS